MALPEQKKWSVVVVGAGPVGLLTALKLGREGISTLVLEAHHELLPTTRAMVYQPVIEPILHGLGLWEMMEKTAYLNHDGVRWRNPAGEVLAHLPLSTEGEFGCTFHLGQATMNRQILKEIAKCPSVEIRFGMKCVGIEDEPSAKTVKMLVQPRNTMDDYIIEADYILGADGSSSAIRRMLCIPFEGFTWPEFKMNGTDILFDFKEELGYTPLNFFVDPEDWGVVAFTGEYGDREGNDPERPRWRVAFIEHTSLPIDQESVWARAHTRVKRFVKGADNYKIISAESYWLQHRCATEARKGRVMLAGDALHSNNPIGGLGLTHGICDAYVYGNAFTRVVKYGEPDSLLTDCANSRRERWLNATSQLAYMNLARLQSVKEDDAKAREEFFYKLNNDPTFARLVRKNMDSMMPDTFERKAAAAESETGAQTHIKAEDLIKMAPKGKPETTAESRSDELPAVTSEKVPESKPQELVEDPALPGENLTTNQEILVPQANAMAVH